MCWKRQSRSMETANNNVKTLMHTKTFLVWIFLIWWMTLWLSAFAVLKQPPLMPLSFRTLFGPWSRSGMGNDCRKTVHKMTNKAQKQEKEDEAKKNDPHAGMCLCGILWEKDLWTTHTNTTYLWLCHLSNDNDNDDDKTKRKRSA